MSTAEAFDRPYPEGTRRCAALDADGAQCPNATQPGRRFCDLPEHQALEDQEDRLDQAAADAAAANAPGGTLAREEAAAAAGAAAIGGAPASDHALDEATAPVVEAGGGEAEGFEESEALLVDHAEQAPEPELTPDGLEEDPELADPDAPPDGPAPGPDRTQIR
jgi:hypothetical protein